MRTAGLPSLLLLLAVLVLGACSTDTDGTGGLRAGAAVQLLDIPVGHSHGGYLQSRRLGAPFPDDDPGSPFASLFPATRGMQSAPRAKAVVLESRGATLAIASVDVAFITSTLTSRVLHHVRKETGLDLEGQLLLTATHTHAGPGRFSDRSLAPGILSGEPERERHALAHGIDTFSEESTDRIARSVALAIGRAWTSREPARVGGTTGTNETASRDRRCHDDWLYGKGDRDTGLGVVKIERESDGSPLAVLVHFALHGTLYDYDNRNLSVDAPGHIEYAVERLFDTEVVALFLQGAAATVSPSGDRAKHTGSQAMVRVGWDVSQTVAALLPEIETKSDVRLESRVRWVRIDRQTLGYKKGEFQEDGGMLCHFLDSTCRESPKDPSAIDCLGKGVEGGGKTSTPLAVARIGDLVFLTLPGEPSPELVRQIRARAGALDLPNVWVLGYSLDHDGYLLLDDDWLSGGSETNITFWGWKYGSYLVERSEELLTGLVGRCGGSGPFGANGPFGGSGTCGNRWDVAPPKPPSFSYTPVAPTESVQPPAPATQPPAQVQRMEEVRFSFHGGDPLLGTPEVRLQRQGGDGVFEDVLLNGWIPVGNLHGPELPTFYEATPTFREAPGATSRAHSWEVVYEPPRDLARGTYRFEVKGKALVGNDVAPFTLHSSPFDLQPSMSLRVEAAIDGGDVFLTLLYPERKPVYSTSPRNGDWQLGGFRPVDPAFRPEFVPVLEGNATGRVSVDGREIEVRFLPMPIPEGKEIGPWRPGEGPSFRAVWEGPGGSIDVPTGTLCDLWGNCNGPGVPQGS